MAKVKSREGYMSLSEVSKLSKVPAPTIKRWSSRGVISKPEKVSYGAGGCRGFWPAQSVKDIKAIRSELKKPGRVTLEEAARRAGEKKGFAYLKEVGKSNKYKKLLEREGEPAKEVLNKLRDLFISKKYQNVRKEIMESVLEKQVVMIFLKLEQEERKKKDK